MTSGAKFRIGVPGFSFEQELKTIDLLGRQPKYEQIKDLHSANEQAVMERRLDLLAKGLYDLKEYVDANDRSEAILLRGELLETVERIDTSGDLPSIRHTPTADLLRRGLECSISMHDSALARLREPPADAPNDQLIDAGGIPDEEQAEPSPVVQIRNLNVRFGENAVLEDVNFSLGRNEIVCIVGDNGSGKSTLLKAIAGAVTPTSGSVSYPILESRFTNFNAIMNEIHMIEASPPKWTGRVTATLRQVAALRGISRTPEADQVSMVMSEMELHKYGNGDVSSLSDGYKTRFEIVKAMLIESGVLLLDEPFGQLDAYTRRKYVRALTELAKSGSSETSIVVVSQDADLLEGVADRVLLLSGGRLRSTNALLSYAKT